MSAALERVIAEQQAEIDWLRGQLENQATYSKKDFEAKEDIFTRAAQVAEWWKLRDCWMGDKSQEWQEFFLMRKGLETSLRDYGFCISCRSLTCAGECRDE